MSGKPLTVRDLINSRVYLLKRQKERLLEDLDDQLLLAEVQELLDDVFHELFDVGYSDLTAMEQRAIERVLKEHQKE